MDAVCHVIMLFLKKEKGRRRKTTENNAAIKKTIDVIQFRIK